MSPHQILAALRRRWWVLVVAAALPAAAGWRSAPSPDDLAPLRYRATQTLLIKPGVGEASPEHPATLALLLTTGDVPVLAATELVDDPAELNGVVEVTGDPGLSVVKITARHPSARFAEKVVDTFARILVDHLQQLEERARADDLARRRAEVEAQRAEIADVEAQLAAQAGNEQVLLEQREVLVRDYTEATDEYEALLNEPPPRSNLESVGPSRAKPIDTGTPRSPLERAIILGAVGLLLGLPTMFALHRLDTRIATREEAVDAFGTSVLAEIPRRPRRRHRSPIEMVAPEGRTSSIAEAYRLLRTTLLLTPPRPGTTQASVFLVTSARPSEGKTTSVVNLAVAFAESGRSVLVLGFDLRRPEMHRRFGVERSPGLTDVLADRTGHLRLADVVRDTSLDGVRVAPAGAPHHNPGELLLVTSDLLDEARSMADVVLVDTTPMLPVHDALQLVGSVDAVILVCRARHTSPAAAGRVRDLLARVDAPVAGMILVGVAPTPGVPSTYWSEHAVRADVGRFGGRRTELVR